MLKSLNESQQKALDFDGNLLIIAGPGTGKTHTLTHKIAATIRTGISPDSILALTFTRKASEEMRERLSGIIGGSSVPFIGTFHALSLKICRTHGAEFKIYSDSEVMKVLRDVLPPEIGAKELRKWRHSLSLYKNQMESIEIPLPSFREVYEKYQKSLAQIPALDLDDLLLHAVKFLRSLPSLQPSYLFVDEFQDINEVQYQLLRLLFGPQTRICAIGDPDQSIYAFRGSNVSVFQRFEEDFPKTLRIFLDTNYRSTKTLLDASSHLIQYNSDRIHHSLASQQDFGEKIMVFSLPDPWEEAKCVARKILKSTGGMDMLQTDQESGRVAEDAHFSDFAILYRTKAQGRFFEEVFKKFRIPYQCLSGKKWYERKAIRFVLACLRFFQDSDPNGLQEFLPQRKKFDSTVSLLTHLEISSLKTSQLLSRLMQLLGLPLKDHKDTHLFLLLLSLSAQFDAFAGIRGIREILEYFSQLRDSDAYQKDLQAVTLMTLHAAKGLEFSVVFIAGVERDLLPYRDDRGFEIEEERRLFFVGMTRAKQKLFLTFSRERDGKVTEVSPFLAELPTHLLEKSIIEKKKRPEIADPQLSLF